MLDIDARNLGPRCAGMSRRDFVRAGALGALGLTLADWFKLQAHAGVTDGKAKSVIQLWMFGGPSHLDTFDPKPEAGDAYCGELKNPIATKAPGMRISELLPLMAGQGDKFSILRGYSSLSSSHGIATYIAQTGTPQSSKKLAYPSTGSVVAVKKGYEAGYQGVLPPFITLTDTGALRISEEGFLGQTYKSLTFGNGISTKGAKQRAFAVRGMKLARGMTRERSAGRRSLLKDVDSLARQMEREKLFQTMDSFQEKAYGLLLGDAKKAFDLSAEKEELRDRYGHNHFGQSCLLARRLVEIGVPFVSINYGGTWPWWDNHWDCVGEMKKRLPIVDMGFSTLLEDLYQRGLLESTLVYWFGEFGRTPKLSGGAWKGGRHHWGAVTPCVVAGGGFTGGAVVGASDAKGERIQDRWVYPWDLTASIYNLMGIDYLGKLPHPQDCGVAYVSPLATGQVPSGGLLTEIM